MSYKYIILLTGAIFLMVPFVLNAQDTIHLRNGGKLEGKVVTIESDQIILSTGEDQPTRILSKSEIKVIVYADGSVETFDDEFHKEINRELINMLSLKKPGVAASWSFFGGVLLPVQGMGQFYNGQLEKGILFFTTGILSYSFAFSGGMSGADDEAQLGLSIYIASLIVSTIDAYSSAKQINEKLLSIRPVFNQKEFRLCASIGFP